MDPQTEVYAIARDFLQDEISSLRGDVYNKVAGAIRARDLKTLASLPDPWSVEYLTPQEHKVLRQVAAFFKKADVFSDEQVCTKAAAENFDAAELACKETNERLEAYYLDGVVPYEDLPSLLSKMQREIARVLGNFDEFLVSLPTRIRLTSGATYSRPRKRALPFLKVTPRIQCAPGSVGYLSALLKYWGVDNYRLDVTPFNRVTFVPKNWKTHRTIACEPDGTLPFQLAFDSYVKDRLRRKTRVDLSSQQRNQELAREGSVSGNYATIDLSAASDSVAINSIHLLFPSEWSSYLMQHRASHYRHPLTGEVRKYHKFASMGNGSTFPVETLLFWAATVALGSRASVVYGDDIIVESHLAAELERLLRFLGFTLNLDKSFISGPFRESCGADWYNGNPVTPVYVRSFNSRATHMSHLVNSLSLISKPGGKLEQRLLTYVRNFKLPLVPLNGSTIAGVWVSPHHAYRLKLILHLREGQRAVKANHGLVTGPWVPFFKGLTPKARSLDCGDSRGLFLWYLGCTLPSGSQEWNSFENPWVRRGRLPQPVRDAKVTSLASVFSHKYVRARILYQPVELLGDVDTRFYLWSEALAAQAAGAKGFVGSSCKVGS